METKIVNSKWEDYLPTLEAESIDLIYTDPPYGMEYRSNIPGSKQWNKSRKSKSKFARPVIGDLKDEFDKIDFSLFFKECFRVLKPNRYMFVHANEEFYAEKHKNFIEAGFKKKGTIIWNKKVSFGGDLKGSMQNNWEPIYYWSKGKPKLNEISINGKVKKRISETREWVFTVNRKHHVGHPTQKPIVLARQIISIACPNGGLVLDPFAGSGTAGVACIQTERNSILVECDNAYCEIMEKRKRAEERTVFHELNQTVKDNFSSQKNIDKP